MITSTDNNIKVEILFVHYMYFIKLILLMKEVYLSIKNMRSEMSTPGVFKDSCWY